MSEIDFRHVLGAFADAVMAADAGDRITYANRAAERLFGWSAAELVGMHLTALMPERMRPLHEAGFQHRLRGDPPTLLGRAVRVPALHRDGHEMDVELTISAHATPDGEIYVASIRDLRERVELEKQIVTQSYLRAATTLGATLSSRLDLDHVVGAAVAALASDFDAVCARIWLFDRVSNRLELRAGASASPDGECDRIDVESRSHPLAEVARTRSPYFAGDLGADASLDQVLIAREKLHSVAAIPLVVGGELRGVMSAYFRRPLEQDLIDVLSTVAAMVSSSINDVQLYEREHATRTRLTAQFEIANVLAEATTREEAMPGVLRAIAGNLGWDRAKFWKVDRRDGALRPAAHWSKGPREEADRDERALPRGEGIPGRVAQTREPIFVGDATRDATFAGDAGLAGFRGAFWFPVRARGEVFGVIELCSRSARATHDRPSETMEGLGDQLGQFFDRIDAQEALREAEQRLVTTLRSIADAVIATDVEGHVTFMNPMAETLTGWRLSEARGRCLEEVFLIVSEDQRTVIENPVARVLRDGRVVGLANHTALVSRNGTVASIEDSGAPIRDDDGHLLGVVMVFRDVTAVRRATNRRRFLAQASSTLASSLDYGVTLTNVAHLAVPRLADWCVVHVVEEGDAVPKPLAIAHVNPSKVQWARELHQRYPDSPDATSGIFHVMRTRKSELYAAIDDDSLERGARSAEHLRILRELSMRSAMVVPMVAHGRAMGTITFVIAESDHPYDEADVAMAEELAGRAALAIDNARLHSSLQEGEERIRLVLESAGEAILGVDAEGRCIFANPASARLLRAPSSEALVGKDIRQLTRHPDAEAPSNRILEAYVRGDGVHVPEELIGRADGSGFWAECWSYPILRHGKRVGAVVTFLDITERKRAEEEHARLLVELEDAVRLRDDFLSIASHELRTPLTPLQLHVQAILRTIRRGRAGELTPALLSDKLESVARQIQRMEKLVDSLLDIARITGDRMHLQPEELDVSALVREVVARHEGELERAGCQARVEAEGPIVGSWDRLRLDQVLSNLLSNATKFGSGMPIDVLVRAEGDGRGRRVRIEVRDRGIGIAPDDQRRIFERFERAVPTRHYGGFGLGLWIVRQIVEAMGGSIHVESTLGAGAAFWVDLPLVSARTSKPPRADDRARSAS